MTVYVFDGTKDGLFSAVFDAFLLKEEPELLLTGGDVLPLFCERIYKVTTDYEKARRVWTGLEKQLPKQAMRMISTSLLSEKSELWQPLFMLVCKVFRSGHEIIRNFADHDVLTVTQIARCVMHEAHRMMQFVRFQKAKDGTYLAVISPDQNVLPLIIHHFQPQIIVGILSVNKMDLLIQRCFLYNLGSVFKPSLPQIYFFRHFQVYRNLRKDFIFIDDTAID